MLKLKQSDFVKALCFTLSVICLLLTYANILLVPELFDNGVYNLSKEDFSKALNMEAVQNFAFETCDSFASTLTLDPYGDVKQFKSFMSEERSNAACEITDSKGNLLYSTFAPDKENCFTYKVSETLFLDTEEAVALYIISKNNGSDFSFGFQNTLDELTMGEVQEFSTEPTFFHEASSLPTTESGTSVSENAPNDREETHISIEETSAFSPDEIYKTFTYNNVVHFNNELYYVDYDVLERENGDRINLIYLYSVLGESAERNSLIYDYCFECANKGLYMDSTVYGTQTGNSVVFFENNYTVDRTGSVIPKETFDIDFKSTDYLYPFTGDCYNVDANVYVSKNIDHSKKDFFTYIDIFSDFAYNYIQAIIPLTITFAILGVILFVFTLWLCGYKKGVSTPVATGWHKVPFDIALIVFSGCWIFLAYVYFEGDETSSLFILPLSSIISLFFIESYAVRLKAHTVISSLACVKIFKALLKFLKRTGSGIRDIARKLSDNINLVWKLALAYGIYFVISFFMMAFAADGHGLLVLLWIFGSFALLVLTVLAALGLSELQNGAKNISEGKLSHRISKKFLFGEFRKNAEYLNSINDAVDKAVTEQMQSERMKTELITNVSHDLKTPLTSIVNYVDLLKKEKIDNPKAAEYIEVIDRQSQRLKKLTFDVVDASKAATGNIQVNFEKCDLGMLLSQVHGEYTDKIIVAKLQTVISLPENPVYINGDGRLLWRVFDNLMSNICKYSLPGTRVYITLTQNYSKAIVVFKNISSTELNISPNELTERFVRGDESRNTEGSGLGLSIAKSLVNAMHGNLSLDIDGDLFKATVGFDCIK